MKRIVIVSGDFHPWGGMDRPNYELAWYAAEHLEIEVHLVAHSVSEPLASHKHVIFHQVTRPFNRHILGGILLRRKAKQVVASLPQHQTRVIGNGGCFTSHDVCWVHAVQAAWNSRHDHMGPLYRLRASLTKKRNRAREYDAIANSNLVITNSESAKQQIVHFTATPPEKVKVVYYGIDAANFRPASLQQSQASRTALGIGEEPVAVFIGTLGFDRNKGIDVLVNAWNKMSQESPDFSMRLLVAGTGGDLNYWRKQQASGTITKQISFMGFTKQIPELICAADILISPTHYDAYGQGVHEAICCGLPAFVTEIAGVAERYPDDLTMLLLTNPPSAEDIIRKVKHWLSDRDAYKQKVSSFSESLRQRSWFEMAEHMIELINQHDVQHHAVATTSSEES